MALSFSIKIMSEFTDDYTETSIPEELPPTAFAHAMNDITDDLIHHFTDAISDDLYMTLHSTVNLKH